MLKNKLFSSTLFNRSVFGSIFFLLFAVFFGCIYLLKVDTLAFGLKIFLNIVIYILLLFFLITVFIEVTKLFSFNIYLIVIGSIVYSLITVFGTFNINAITGFEYKALYLFWYIKEFFSNKAIKDIAFIIYISILLLAFILYYSIFTIQKYSKKNPKTKIYILLLLFLSIFLHSFIYFSIQQTTLVIYFFVFITFSDSFAYFGGSRFGKNKICRLSPNKSWQGFGFGLAGALGISLLFFGILTQIKNNENFILFSFKNTKIGFKIMFFILCPLIFGVLSQISDFLFSGVKRVFGVKDFSRLFQSHGGLLDRFDSFFLPFFILYWIKTFINYS